MRVVKLLFSIPKRMGASLSDAATTCSPPPKFVYPSITLNTGASMPQLGLGTYLSEPGEVGQAVRTALETGYRHIDCAADYENEAEVGVALASVFKQGKIKRQDVFITSKLWVDVKDAGPGQVVKSLQKTLKDLQLDYLDLYLVHEPFILNKNAEGDSKPARAVGWGLQDVWRQMEQCQMEGLTKAIGVSNYNVQTLNDCLTYAKIPPAMNQIELHPYLPQPELRSFCAQYNVAVTAYAPLGSPGSDAGGAKVPLMKNEVVQSLAKKYDKTPAQILIRFCLESGAVCIPKSVKPHCIQENFEALGFSLEPEDMDLLAKGVEHKQRFFKQDWTGLPTFF
eukprot:gb/GEZN01012624.1/.p1 GENE.gb/GEZN01012624.1/~~gb/GEZN01012624.1/.p1  ORF type:complete len:338 (+),score=62.44 gb/GEZN01012624.1/:14-1027(+)